MRDPELPNTQRCTSAVRVNRAPDHVRKPRDPGAWRSFRFGPVHHRLSNAIHRHRRWGICVRSSVDYTTMQLAQRLNELNLEVEAFTCRPRTLAGDLVLLGLASDILETGMAVLHTAASSLPHKAFANARLVFEGAQQLVVLATHESYEISGAMAWVYFEAKSARWRAHWQHRRSSGTPQLSDQKLLEQRVSEMAAIWDSVCDGQGKVLRDAFVRFGNERKTRPDNWLLENLTTRQHRAYQIFAASTGAAVSADGAKVNQSMYEVLCHETHTHPRLDSFGVIHNHGNETMKIDRLPRDMERARSAVTGGTELAVREAALGLRWQRAGAA